MTKSNDKIIKVDFGNKQKTESIDNGLLDYFGFNEKNKNKTILPTITMPFDLSAKTSIIFEREYFIWMLMDKFKDTKNRNVNKMPLQSVLCYDLDELLEEKQFDLFVPDNIQKCENILFLGNLDVQGIKEFKVLQQQQALKNIRPWISMYEIMIERSQYDKEKSFELKEDISSSELNDFSKYFDPEVANKIKKTMKIDKKGISEKILKLDDFA